MNVEDKRVLFFDLDGTIAEFKTGILLPGVMSYFQSQIGNDDIHFELVTNQGGAGLRRWMKTKDFGNPDKYPSEMEVYFYIEKVLQAIYEKPKFKADDYPQWIVNIAFNYCTKQGGNSPEFDEYPETTSLWWYASHEVEWRKPSGYIIKTAMTDNGYEPQECLMVGDDWGNEDSGAARNAGIDFLHADDFFNRTLPADVPF